MIRLHVKKIAAIKGFSQGGLARAANLDVNVVRRIYRNPYETITTETLDKLARALNVNASSLVTSDPPLPDFVIEISEDESVQKENDV